MFERTLAAGEKILVEPGGFLYKDSTVEMNTVQQNVKTGMLRHGMYLARDGGPGPGRHPVDVRSPPQRMTVTPPAGLPLPVLQVEQ